jgi:hypothetical protein
MTVTFYAEANMLMVEVSARLALDPRTKENYARRRPIAPLSKIPVFSLTVNVDGMTRSKDIATFCQETPSGLR